jgi:hypothetical protein
VEVGLHLKKHLVDAGDLLLYFVQKVLREMDLMGGVAYL